MLVISVCCSWHGVDSPGLRSKQGESTTRKRIVPQDHCFWSLDNHFRIIPTFWFQRSTSCTLATFEHSCLVSPRIWWMCACARTASPKHIQTLQVEISADLDLDLVEAGPKYPNMSKRGRTRRAVEGSPDQAAICRNNVHLMLDFRVKLLQSVLLNSFTMSHVFPCFSWCFIFFHSCCFHVFFHFTLFSSFCQESPASCLKSVSIASSHHWAKSVIVYWWIYCLIMYWLQNHYWSLALISSISHIPS